MRRATAAAVVVSFLMMLFSVLPVYAGTWTEHEDKTWTYTDEEGKSLTGWIEDGDGKTYYLDEDGILKTGWFKQKGSWYYFDEKGVLAKDTWVDNYYVNAEGKMKGVR